MISIKPPKTFDEQIEILKSRGLIIEDEEYAKFILSNVNPNRIFTYIVAMNYLMVDRIAWNKFFIKLQGIINDYSSYIDLELIGFPNNWVEILSKF